jgi:hypothetical protein
MSSFTVTVALFRVVGAGSSAPDATGRSQPVSRSDSPAARFMLLELGTYLYRRRPPPPLKPPDGRLE